MFFLSMTYTLWHELDTFTLFKLVVGITHFIFEKPNCQTDSVFFITFLFVWSIFFFTFVCSCILNLFQNLSVLLAPVVTFNTLVIEAIMSTVKRTVKAMFSELFLSMKIYSGHAIIKKLFENYNSNHFEKYSFKNFGETTVVILNFFIKPD